MQTGKLAVFNGSSIPMELKTRQVRSLLPGEILVRNLYTTLCGSDLHTYSGHRKEACPTVLGHEIVGEVIDVHPGQQLPDLKGRLIQKGDTITWSIFSSDPDSRLAREGIPQKGDHLYKYGHQLIHGEDVFHGGLAEFCILARHTAVLILPNDIPLPVAATINCALSTAAGALRVAGDIAGKNIMIYGMGMLGIAAASMCKAAGASWIGGADISEKRLNDSRMFGVDETFNLRERGIEPAAFRDKFANKGADITIDMSGSPEAMESGLDILCIGGVAVWIGAVLKIRPVNVDSQQVIRNILTIRGLHNYNFEDFIYAYDFITTHWKKYPFEKAVEKEFDLGQVEQAFEYAIQHKPLRVGVRL